MIRFSYDYCEGTHKHILRELTETNLEQTPGYGEDHYYAGVADIIRNLCGQEDTAVHFLVGGAQANMTVAAFALRSYQGVAGVVTAHINVHETSFIEAAGHKVLVLPSEDGKVTTEWVGELYQAYIWDENPERTMQPKMAYTSNPTELDTIYTRSELEDLYEVYRRYELYLFADGARLACDLATEGSDLDFKSLVATCDVFHIGGTKAGALFGETMVILNDGLRAGFRYHIKRRDGILAKGRLLSIQSGELLRGGLCSELGAHVDKLVDRIHCACVEKGYSFLMENTTGQIFPIIPDFLLESWKDKYSYTNQGRVDESRTAIRLYISQITNEERAGVPVDDILNS